MHRMYANDMQIYSICLNNNFDSKKQKCGACVKYKYMYHQGLDDLKYTEIESWADRNHTCRKYKYKKFKKST